MKSFVISFTLLAGLSSLSAFGAEPETEAVEFYNRTLDHYFITATSPEARQLDDGAAGPGWVRTGRSFQAWLDPANAPANAAAVCRFYSSGANSHFYTSDASECESLKQLESAERERNRATNAPVLGWQYEGIAFRIEPPVAGACPAGTVAVSRVYNNGFATGKGSNHRFVDDSELRALMVDRSWVSEGVAFCSRSRGSGTNANLPATTSGFDTVAGHWSGSARMEKKSGGSELSAPLALDVSSSGAVTGSAAGCAFSGQIASGDGFRSLFTGSLTAGGCSDAAFNGRYRRFDLERYGSGTLMLVAKLGDGAGEASIEATLSLASAAPPPNGGPATPPAGIAGNFNGTFTADVEVRNRTTNTTTTSSSTSSLQLGVSSAGAVSGSGFGCTFSGTLAPSAVAGVFTGTLSAAGCPNAALNATYAASAHAEDGGALSLEMQAESESGNVRTKVGIKGTAARAS